jgi:hypothetical protein
VRDFAPTFLITSSNFTPHNMDFRQKVEELLETIGKISPKDLDNFPPDLIQKVKKLLYRLPSLTLDMSRLVNLLASLLRHRDQILAFLITDARTTVRKRLLFTSDDPCIDDITRV